LQNILLSLLFKIVLSLPPLLETSLKGLELLLQLAIDGVSVEPRDTAKELDLDLDFPEAAKVIVDEGEGPQVQQVKLQLCK
jgi:hypothetical protein